MFMCPYEPMLVTVRPEEGIQFPGVGVTGICEPSDVDAGKRTRVPQKSSTHS